MLGLHCCVGFPLVADSRGCSLVVMHRLLTVVALLVAELRLNCSEARGAFSLWWLFLLQSSGLIAPRHVGLPGSGIEPVSAALSGGFFTTEPPGKP